MPYPAAYDGVLGVGAIGPDGVRQDFSQVGPYVDIVAPGGDVTVAWPDGRYSVQSGTSYATPFVAATAALVRDYRPDLTAREVVRRIVATADPAPGGVRSRAYGSGVVNPYRAVTETVAGAAAGAATAARGRRRSTRRCWRARSGARDAAGTGWRWRRPGGGVAALVLVRGAGAAARRPPTLAPGTAGITEPPSTRHTTPPPQPHRGMTDAEPGTPKVGTAARCPPLSASAATRIARCCGSRC